MKEITQYRQGDVLLEKIAQPMNASRMRKSRRVKQRLILGKGEATGHAHTVHDESASLYLRGIERILEVVNPCDLQHEQHSSVALEPGFYRVIRQREYREGWDFAVQD